MDGPRLLKLNSAFGKMVNQIFAETELGDSTLKEELHSAFTQLLLKYAIPSKLNELDIRLAQPKSAPEDVTAESAIRQILASHLQLPASTLTHALAGEAARLSQEIAQLQATSHQLDEEIAQTSAAINQWIEQTQAAMAQIKQQTQ